MFIAFGDLELDYYIRDGLVVGLTNGGSSLLTLANLAKSFKTKYVSVSGNDSKYQVCKLLFDKLKIENINKIENIDTKILFVKSKGIVNRCPYCDRLYNYESKLDIDYILDNIRDEKIIIDSLDELNMNIINKLDNEMYLILKDIDSIQYYDLDELIELKNKFELVYLSSCVINYLIKKYDIDEVDILHIFESKMLIIDKKYMGLEFIYNDTIIVKDRDNSREIVDISGSMEAEFASIIKVYLDNNKEINDRVISLMFIRGEIIFSILTNKIGSLSHVLPNYMLDSYKECICKDINIKNM